MSEEKLCIVAIGADAFEVFKGVGGTLIKYANQGARIVPVGISSTGSPEVTERKREESRQAAKFAGFDEPRFLNYSELQLANMANSLEAVQKIADIIRDVKPDIVFTHWIEDQSDGLSSHAAAGYLGEKAMKIAALEDYESDLPTHESKVVMYFLSSESTPAHLTWGPDVFINVENEILKLHQCFQLHTSQTAADDGGATPTLLREFRLVPRRFWGVTANTFYAEAFKLPQYIGVQYAYEGIPDVWLTPSNRGAILGNVTDPETGATAHPRLSIPTDWPDSLPLPRVG